MDSADMLSHAAFSVGGYVVDHVDVKAPLAALAVFTALFALTRHLARHQRGKLPCPKPTIVGDEAFRAKLERSLALAETTPNAYLLDSVSEIRQGDINHINGADCAGDIVRVHQCIRNSDEELAADLIHEASHAHHGHSGIDREQERVAATDENVARRHFGLSRIDPNDFSWHAANYPEAVAENDAPAEIPVQAASEQSMAPAKSENRKIGWPEAWARSLGRSELKLLRTMVEAGGSISRAELHWGQYAHLNGLISKGYVVEASSAVVSLTQEGRCAV
jgi:hypothetical protein